MTRPRPYRSTDCDGYRRSSKSMDDIVTLGRSRFISTAWAGKILPLGLGGQRRALARDPAGEQPDLATAGTARSFADPVSLSMMIVEDLEQ